MNNVTVYLIIIVTALLVHSIKFIRIYLAFYGNGMKMKECLRTFCIATPISMLIPFKLGEIFRVLAYGKRVKNYFRGFIVVLLDRFMDTLALITVMLLVYIFNGNRITAISYFLLIFLIIILWIYLAFPHIYKIWKRSLLLAKATEHRLEILSVLDKMNDFYYEMDHTVKGRGLVLYFLSLLAWVIEIGGISMLVFFTDGELKDMIGQYLSSAMMGMKFIWLQKMIFVSICILFGLYMILIIEKIIKGRKTA